MAATLTGVAVTQTKSDNTPAAGLSRCNYMNDAGTAGFDVSYIGSHAKSGFDAELEAAKTVGGSMAGPTVTGVGDAAFVNHFGMSALYGDAEIHVAIISTLTQAQMTTLIEALHAKL